MERVFVRDVGRVEVVRAWARLVRWWEIWAGRVVGCGGSVPAVARARRVSCWCWRWAERRGAIVGRLDWKATISGDIRSCASWVRFMLGASER